MGGRGTSSPFPPHFRHNSLDGDQDTGTAVGMTPHPPSGAGACLCNDSMYKACSRWMMLSRAINVPTLRSFVLSRFFPLPPHSIVNVNSCQGNWCLGSPPPRSRKAGGIQPRAGLPCSNSYPRDPGKPQHLRDIPSSQATALNGAGLGRTLLGGNHPPRGSQWWHHQDHGLQTCSLHRKPSNVCGARSWTSSSDPPSSLWRINRAGMGCSGREGWLWKAPPLGTALGGCNPCPCCFALEAL